MVTLTDDTINWLDRWKLNVALSVRQLPPVLHLRIPAS